MYTNFTISKKRNNLQQCLYWELTQNLRFKRPLLYQLSYIMLWVGFEPTKQLREGFTVLSL